MKTNFASCIFRAEFNYVIRIYLSPKGFVLQYLYKYNFKEFSFLLSATGVF